MSANRNILRSTQYEGGSTLPSAYSLSGGTEINLSELVPASATTQYTSMVFAHANVVAWSALAAATGLTLKWNSSGSPVDTMVLPGGVSADWDTEKLGISATQFPNPFTVDITTLFVTNSTTSAIQLDLSILLA